MMIQPLLHLQMCTGGFSFFTLVLVLAVLSPRGWADAVVRDGDGGIQDLELWCVAKNNVEDKALRIALNWACGQGGASCRPIQKGGACHFPADLVTMASYAFNDYYLKHGLTNDSCYFGNAAAVTSLNPSKGKCNFPSSFTVKDRNFTGQSTPATLGPVLPYEAINGGLFTKPWMQLGSFTLISNLFIVSSWILG